MSLLLSRLSRLRLGKVRNLSHSLLVSNGFSSTSFRETPPCLILGAESYLSRDDLGGLIIFKANEGYRTCGQKKVLLELFNKDLVVTLGSSHGWVATRLIYDDGRLRLEDDLNPYASEEDPKRISLPPFVTLPHCQTEIVTNVAMSSSSPEDEDCVLAVKFLGPQLSFCRPATAQGEWTNIRIENPSFYSSRVMFSKKDDMFRILGSGGHLIGSWDPCKPSDVPTTTQEIRFRNLPQLTKTKQEILHSCCTSEHLVDSITTGEIFIVKWFRRTGKGTSKMKTKALMVYKLDDQGNAVYTEDIGDLCIFLSKSEPFCVPASSFPGIGPNKVKFSDVDEYGTFDIGYNYILSHSATLKAPYHIPPQTQKIN